MAIALLPDYLLTVANMNAGTPSASSGPSAMDTGLRRNDPELRQNGQQSPTRDTLVMGANLPSSSIFGNAHQISTWYDYYL
jgi:hypothetical protein